MSHIMIDLETLDTTADAVICSIGAVKFDLHSKRMSEDTAFYSSVSIKSNLDLSRRLSEPTLLWWLSQPKEAQAVFHEPKVSLYEALEAFSSWVCNGVGELQDKNTYVWGNGSDFDITILSHAYTQLGLKTPWRYNNVRCFRTFKNLFPQLKAAPFIGVKHNALADAVNQARHAQAIQRALVTGQFSNPGGYPND